MPIKSPSGKKIITAGEVGSFCVCPEAWRLRTLEKVDSAARQSIEDGRRLHAEWANMYNEALYLTHRAKFVIALLAVACVLYFMKSHP